MKNIFRKAIRLISLIGLFSIGWYVFVSIAWTGVQETTQETVDRLFQFYQTSGYENGREYKKDIENLQRIKQKELDNFNYEQSILYAQKQETSDEFVLKIDETIALAKEWIKTLETPSYLKYGKDITSTNTSASDLVFEKLLK